MSLPPWNPRSAYPRSSATRSTTFGRLASAPVADPGSHADANAPITHKYRLIESIPPSRFQDRTDGQGSRRASVNFLLAGDQGDGIDAGLTISFGQFLLAATGGGAGPADSNRSECRSDVAAVPAPFSDDPGPGAAGTAPPAPSAPPASSFRVDAASASSRWCGFEAPTIGAVTPGWCSSQASATWAFEHAAPRRDLAHAVHHGEVARPRSTACGRSRRSWPGWSRRDPRGGGCRPGSPRASGLQGIRPTPSSRQSGFISRSSSR